MTRGIKQTERKADAVLHNYVSNYRQRQRSLSKSPLKRTAKIERVLECLMQMEIKPHEMTLYCGFLQRTETQKGKDRHIEEMGGSSRQ